MHNLKVVFADFHLDYMYFVVQTHLPGSLMLNTKLFTSLPFKSNFKTGFSVSYISKVNGANAFV